MNHVTLFKPRHIVTFAFLNLFFYFYSHKPIIMKNLILILFVCLLVSCKKDSVTPQCDLQGTWHTVISFSNEGNTVDVPELTSMSTANEYFDLIQMSTQKNTIGQGTNYYASSTFDYDIHEDCKTIEWDYFGTTGTNTIELKEGDLMIIFWPSSSEYKIMIRQS